jgi:hypothetical protein
MDKKDGLSDLLELSLHPPRCPMFQNIEKMLAVFDMLLLLATGDLCSFNICCNCSSSAMQISGGMMIEGRGGGGNRMVTILWQYLGNLKGACCVLKAKYA